MDQDLIVIVPDMVMPEPPNTVVKKLKAKKTTIPNTSKTEVHSHLQLALKKASKAASESHKKKRTSSGCAAQVENLNPSGRTLEDKLEMTQRTYESSVPNGTPTVAKTIEKVARKNAQRSPTTMIKAWKDHPNHRLLQPIQLPRMLPRALHRAKGEGVDDWKDGVATAQSEIAIQAKRQNDIFESDSKSLQSIAKTAQTNAEIAIMNKNLDDCSELVRRYYEARQRAIVEALESQGN
ncbi:hypothetical protein PSTT_08185 [Puccinia striiformis]|uniref:No apical meristem-associated C-terminal domain-containing protein n=1 Tax=Puccinia striiformis TaxID=27350 RepID=A0A2S4VDQ1_9BASI|nr:hypothetical protein PSTT_08185 [Puccinia striiformis]